MIVTENIELQLDLPLTNAKVEALLFQKGIKPLRWAVIKASDRIFTINVSYEKV